jgi:hypothetical protein
MRARKQAPGAGMLAAWLTLAMGAGAARAGDAMLHAPSPIEQAYRAGKAAEAAGNEAAARSFYQRGVELARATLAATPDAPDALLWLPPNLAREALTRGKVDALRAIPEIEATLLHLERVAPSYDHAAAARALGNLYWKAPSLISVGSSKKAAQYFRLALARDPTFPGNQAHAAAFFADEHDCGTARPLAEAVARRADLDAFGPDAAEWRQLAGKVLRGCEGRAP